MVYAIAQLNITDRAVYDRYQARFMGVMKKFRGRVLAAGRQELGSPAEQRDTATADGRLYQKPPCNFCDFSALCGLKGDLS